LYTSFRLYITVCKGATLASFCLHNFTVYTAALSLKTGVICLSQAKHVGHNDGTCEM